MDDAVNGTRLPLSSRELIPYTPANLCDAEGNPRPGAPVYRIKVPSVIEVAQWRRDVRAAGARYPAPSELYRAIRQGVDQAAPENRGKIAEALDRLEALGPREEPDPRDAELVDAVAALLEPQFPPVAALMAARDFWAAIAPFKAAQRFLKGWENVTVKGAPLAFRVAPSGLVADAALEALPRGHLAAVGWKAVGLMSVPEEQEKNS